MDDRKADAAYHPNTKPRDEIAQVNVDDREKTLGVELSDLPQIPIGDLGQGDVVLHEGIWCEIGIWSKDTTVGSIWLHLMRAGRAVDDPPWYRQIVVMPDEKFYVKS